MKTCLIIFAKEPQDGRVKTRLQQSLPDISCIDLYKAFVKDIVEECDIITCDLKILAYEADGREPQYLKEIAGSMDLYQQRGSDLGERMNDAFEFGQLQGAGKMVIIGTDIPLLSCDIINEAFSLLESKDMVLGPTQDGGYFLIGLKQPCPELFEGVVWSSSSVLRKTLENAQSTGKSVALLPELYDIDKEQDLFRLKDDLEGARYEGLAKRTRDFLRNTIVRKQV